ncbi:MAG: tRNA pseudouridine(13) synthase TruD [Deltaproteobacteria bacterium]|nr:tRNA pseudouridine(13) synthase TruD [Deltaproteobacteria bacterium]
MDEARPRIRQAPEDFRVEEIPLYEPAGEGDHLFVEVEKRLRTSDEVARLLARALGVRARDIGYAGRKDRVAVTRQWYSLPGVEAEALSTVELQGVRILRAIPHRHKLRTGHLRGNRFEIRVRGVDREAEAAARSCLDGIARIGMPNRYGVQRFGRGGRNPDDARDILLGGRGPRDRRAARFLLSALQADVFNRVLAARPLGIDAVEVGDVAQVVASGGLFLVEDAAVDGERAARFEISPTGPIFGTKMSAPAAAPAAREESVMLEAGIPPSEEWRLPRGLKLKGARRPLRVAVEEVSLARDADDLVLAFVLRSGSYATVLLEELFGELDEARARADSEPEPIP